MAKGQSQKSNIKGAKQPLSRVRVMHAAIALADESGLDALSMRKLAQRLGVEAMSLYNHIRNKNDLLDGMVEQVVAEIQFPAESGPVSQTDWKQVMRQRAQSAYRVLLRHPWATLMIISRVNVGPVMLRYVDATLGCLVEAGFSFEMADHIWNAIDSYLYGFTLQQLNFPFEPEDYSAAAAGYIKQLPEQDYPYLHRLTRQVAEKQYDGRHQFEMGLNILLDGLEKLEKE
ncbi:MAG: TetR/AcrR family transcriptional regulator C-terminal domain-containing protein [Cyanobacteria bacterium P01_H01_bin.119]